MGKIMILSCMSDKLLEKCNDILENIAVTKLNLNLSKTKPWPKSASLLTRRINGIKTNLTVKGIEIILGRGEKGKRTITVCKVPYMPSMASKTSDSSQTTLGDSEEAGDEDKEEKEAQEEEKEEQQQESKEEKYQREQEEMKKW